MKITDTIIATSGKEDHLISNYYAALCSLNHNKHLAVFRCHDEILPESLIVKDHVRYVCIEKFNNGDFVIDYVNEHRTPIVEGDKKFRRESDCLFHDIELRSSTGKLIQKDTVTAWALYEDGLVLTKVWDRAYKKNKVQHGGVVSLKATPKYAESGQYRDTLPYQIETIIMDRQGKKTKLPSDVQIVNNLHDGWMQFSGGKYHRVQNSVEQYQGFCAYDGTIKIKLQYVNGTRNFNQKRALVNTYNKRSGQRRLNYIDEQGKYLFEKDKLTFAYDFSEGLAFVCFRNEGRYSIIDHNGIPLTIMDEQISHEGKTFRYNPSKEQYAYDLIYPDIPVHRDPDFKHDFYWPIAYMDYNQEMYGRYRFKDGVAICQLWSDDGNQKIVTLVNQEGRRITDSLFQDATLMHNGIAGVKTNVGWGLISQEGKILIAPSEAFENPPFFNSDGTASLESIDETADVVTVDRYGNIFDGNMSAKITIVE